MPLIIPENRILSKNNLSVLKTQKRFKQILMLALRMNNDEFLHKLEYFSSLSQNREKYEVVNLLNHSPAIHYG